MKYIIQTFLLLLLTSQVVQAQDLPQDFDEMVVADMEKWHAPGLGLAIVKDGKTILTKGYGVKSFETNDPVNENTLFQAGSTTKAFVAMSLAMLVDEGKVNWDDPIIKHIPEFKMKNKYVQNHLTIADALSHSSGVSQLSNLNMFYGEDIGETWALMANIGQQDSFRGSWDYNNTTFALGGRVVERVSGKKLHKFIEERILDPLGMDDTHLLDHQVRSDENRAEAHQYFEGKSHQIPYPYIEYTQAAGMINSTPVDMAKWMELLLAEGQWDGVGLVSPERIKEMMKPHILLEPGDVYPAAATYNQNYYSYGMAWFVHDYKGHKIAMHTGSIDGMIAIVAVVPEQKMGVYVFINSDHIEYRHALMNTVMDIVLDLPRTNWSEKLYPIFHPQEDTSNEEAETFPEIASQDLIGTYDLEGSYPLMISENNGILQGRFGTQNIEITQAENNSYLYINPAARNFSKVRKLNIKIDDNGHVKNIIFNGYAYDKQ
ncbi:MAG: beta-lactamase family protein [Kordiimonadaceae bacterium]|jgi:CubicO group peptidase (beta-lactamase class C family)|nr:beta-lactamase family protein [Kordiimonadaceae bacterium]MBT6036854.1 beta-lactamase family protein [Kordiimonadaceae bacterium]